MHSVLCTPQSERARVGYSGGSATERTEGICVVLLQTLTSDWHQCTVHIPPVLPLSFLHTPTLNILLWKNPLRRYRPLPLHMLKISSQDHLYNPPLLALFSFCLPDVWPSHLFTSWFIIPHKNEPFYVM